MKYKIFTNVVCGWIYEVEANSEEEAEEKFDNGEFIKDYENLDWKEESNEEITSIEESHEKV